MVGEKRTLGQVRLRQGVHLAKEKPSPGAPSRQKAQNGAGHSAGKPHKSQKAGPLSSCCYGAGVAILFLVHTANSARYTHNTTVGDSYSCYALLPSPIKLCLIQLDSVSCIWWLQYIQVIKTDHIPTLSQ